MKQSAIFASLAAMLLAVGTGCDDAPQEESGWQTAGPADNQPTPPAPVAPDPAEPAEEEAIQRPELNLSDVDFTESATNRDPFRSFLGEFKQVQKPSVRMQRKTILPRFGLDELRLIAVVTGNRVRPRAMFRDPTGLGVTVKRGDYISKSSSRIKRIFRDKVVVEIEEQVETRDQEKRRATYTDRVIELHPSEDEVALPTEVDAETATPAEAPAEKAAPAPQQGGGARETKGS